MHDPNAESTRRRFLAGTGVAIGGMVAGCTGEGSQSGAETPADGNGETPDAETPAAETPTDTAMDTATPTTADGYTVSMEPMGTVEFDSVPERWLPYSAGYADMGVALGQADGMAGIGQAGEYHTDVYAELPGVSVDRDRLAAHDLVDAGMSKELFYELDCDVHVIDPNLLRNWFDWSEADVTEIRENVAPFLGNHSYRRSDDWHDYRYYTMYEAFGKMADLFQERERFEAFKEFHDTFVADVQSRLPPAEERPTVLLVFESSDRPEAFSPYRLDDRGTNKKQWHDLGVRDALAGTGVESLSTTDRDKLDYEALLDLDPDVLLIRGHEEKSPSEFRDTVLGAMREHPVGSELTAVTNGRVYRGGPLKQGPIQNIFLTERAAKQLYPEEFGDVTDDRELFDRQQVADIVTGEM